MMIKKVHFVLLTVMSYCYDFVMLGSRQEPTATPEGHGSLFGKSKYQKLTGAGTTEKQVKKIMNTGARDTGRITGKQ